MKRNFLAILPLGILLVAGCGGSKGATIATINGESITKDEFYKEMELKKDATIVVDPRNLKGQGSSLPAQPLTGPLADGNIGFETLKTLIGTKLTMQLAADQGVLPTPAEINQQIDEIKKENPMELNQALSNGYTLDYIRNQISFSLAKEKIVTRGINITPAQVDQYIKENPQDGLYYQPAKASIQYVVVKPEDQSKVDQEIASGKAIDLVSEQYSADRSMRDAKFHLGVSNDAQDPTVPVPVTAFSQKLQDIIQSTAEGTYSKWVQDGAQTIKFYIAKKVAEKTLPVDADMRKKLSRALALKEGAKSIDLDAQVMAKLKDSKVTVNDEVLKPLWDQFQKNLKNQANKESIVPNSAPVTTASPSAAAPSPSPSK